MGPPTFPYPRTRGARRAQGRGLTPPPPPQSRATWAASTDAWTCAVNSPPLPAPNRRDGLALLEWLEDARPTYGAAANAVAPVRADAYANPVAAVLLRLARGRQSSTLGNALLMRASPPPDQPASRFEPVRWRLSVFRNIPNAPAAPSCRPRLATWQQRRWARSLSSCPLTRAAAARRAASRPRRLLPAPWVIWPRGRMLRACCRLCPSINAAARGAAPLRRRAGDAAARIAARRSATDAALHRAAASGGRLRLPARMLPPRSRRLRATWRPRPPSAAVAGPATTSRRATPPRRRSGEQLAACSAGGPPRRPRRSAPTVARARRRCGATARTAWSCATRAASTGSSRAGRAAVPPRVDKLGVTVSSFYRPPSSCLAIAAKSNHISLLTHRALHTACSTRRCRTTSSVS